MRANDNAIVRVEFIKYLHDVKRNQLAWLVSETNIELEDHSKYCVRYGHIVMLKANYLKLENARRKKLGIKLLKKAGKLPWGEWEIEGVLINHNGDRYLRYYPYDGELQESQVNIYDEEGKFVFTGHPDYHVVYDHWKALRKSHGICRNIFVSRIVQLTLLDNKGDPNVDVIYEKYETNENQNENKSV